ncbi:hydrophobic W protein [Streptomyces prasinopilosus]|uniref:Hydrophobic W protein n=1 Tax=Streptomyces prasinopilosus TaxID=67344 RepID=A0A1G7A025_9ACTN|nr:hydrophobic W protein [Streptomyces prasinopilosus]
MDNLGNTRVTASIGGSDNGDQLSFDLEPSNVQIEPGRAVFVRARLKPREIIWFGSKQERPYALAVQRSGVDPQSVEGTFVQRGFLPGWLATVLGMTLALAIAFVVIWLSYKPDVRSLATEQMTEVGAGKIPAPSPALSPPASEAPEAPPAGVPAPPAVTEPEQAGGAGNGEGAGAGGGGSGEKETEAPERTAAAAVLRLAAEDPGGRHICYRVYAAGQGWTDAVCDGETAGAAGSGTPLKAVNIAVSGTKGTSGGAFVPDPASTKGEGHFPDPWTNAADGIDNYVGSTEEDAPDLMGFTVNVDGGRGAVCQSTYVHDDAWLSLACDEPGTGYDFTYAGTHDNALWIEAVRLTV